MPSFVPHLFLKLANAKDSELEACEYLDMFAKKCGFTQEVIDEMRLAFIEALINAKEHAPKDLPEEEQSHKEIYISFTFEDELLTINVRDFGKGFDPTTIEKPDIKKKLKSSYKRGWGIMLMERLMDGYEITSFPPSGTLMHLVKKRIDPVKQTEAEKNAEMERNRVERLKYILSSCIDLSSFLCQSKGLEQGLRSMLRILLGTLAVSRGAIYTFEKNNKSLECLVDIKLRANARLPQVSITPEIFDKLISKPSTDIIALVNEEINQFRETFKEGEIEHIYPLSTDDANLGLLILGYRFHKEEAVPFDTELLTIITRNISSAMNTYKLMHKFKEANENLDYKVRELDSIREASQTISSELELENLPNTVESIFRSVMGIKKFSMCIFDPTENRYSICKNDRNLPTTLDLWSSHISQHVIQTKEPLFIPNIKTVDNFSFPRATKYSSSSFIVIPIVVANEVLALVNLSDKNDSEQLTDNDFHMAKLLCSQLGIALKNANLYKRGITDTLTRLYTNHYFKLRLSQEISRQRRIKSSLSVAMVAIDNIESYINKYGVHFRDNVLSTIGSIIKRLIRFNDLPCRYEGNKFAIIMPDTDKNGCLSACEKVIDAVREVKFSQDGSEENISLTISITQFNITMNQAQFLETADKILKKAKEAGGNRIYTEDDIK